MNVEATKNKGEELLKTTARNASTFAENVAGQLEETVQRSLEKLAEMQEAVVDKTKEAAHATDEYVHENPWKAIGLAAGLGIVLGLLMRRR